MEKHIDGLIGRYPILKGCREDILAGYRMMEACYERDGKLLIAGNGGSAADSEHMAGELMKRFRMPRPLVSGREREASLSEAPPVVIP